MSFSTCAVSDPVSEDYYAGTDKIAGGEAPGVPTVTYTASQNRFDFTASIDPDTSAEVGSYIVYLYSGIPSAYYESRYIEAIIPSSSPRAFYVTVASGTYTVIVTGFDGYRESAVTAANRITFTVP